MNRGRLVMGISRKMSEDFEESESSWLSAESSSRTDTWGQGISRQYWKIAHSLMDFNFRYDSDRYYEKAISEYSIAKSDIMSMSSSSISSHNLSQQSTARDQPDDILDSQSVERESKHSNLLSLTGEDAKKNSNTASTIGGASKADDQVIPDPCTSSDEDLSSEENETENEGGTLVTMDSSSEDSEDENGFSSFNGPFIRGVPNELMFQLVNKLMSKNYIEAYSITEKVINYDANYPMVQELRSCLKDKIDLDLGIYQHEDDELEDELPSSRRGSQLICFDDEAMSIAPSQNEDTPSVSSNEYLKKRDIRRANSWAQDKSTIISKLFLPEKSNQRRHSCAPTIRIAIRSPSCLSDIADSDNQSECIDPVKDQIISIGSSSSSTLIKEPSHSSIFTTPSKSTMRRPSITGERIGTERRKSIMTITKENSLTIPEKSIEECSESGETSNDDDEEEEEDEEEEDDDSEESDDDDSENSDEDELSSDNEDEDEEEDEEDDETSDPESDSSDDSDSEPESNTQMMTSSNSKTRKNVSSNVLAQKAQQKSSKSSTPSISTKNSKVPSYTRRPSIIGSLSTSSQEKVSTTVLKKSSGEATKPKLVSKASTLTTIKDVTDVKQGNVQRHKETKNTSSAVTSKSSSCVTSNRHTSENNV